MGAPISNNAQMLRATRIRLLTRVLPSNIISDKALTSEFRAEVARPTLDVHHLAEVIRTMQSCLSLPAVDNTLREHLTRLTEWHADVRMQMLAAAATRAGRAYGYERVIHGVIASGLLKNVSELRAVLKHAIAATVQEPTLLDMLKKMLDEDHALPSATTLLRHRMSLHMCYCRALQHIHATMIGGTGGMVSWRSMDLSPQGGVEWVLHGASAVRHGDLDRALLLSLHIANHTDDEAEMAAMQELQALLQLRQAVPTGVGSGRKDLVHKIHGMIHSARLTCPSWKATAAAISGTVTIVGDLGEASAASYKGDLKTLFGPWVVASDEAQSPAPGDDDVSFDFGAVMRDAGGAAAEPADDSDAAEFDFFAKADRAATGNQRRPLDLPPPPPDYTVDLTRTVYIVGPHHVLHNITQAVPSVCAGWEDYIQKLKQVSKLLSQKWTGERVVATCFASDPAALFAEDVKKFTAHVYDSRWNTAMEATREVLSGTTKRRQPRLKRSCAWPAGPSRKTKKPRPLGARPPAPPSPGPGPSIQPRPQPVAMGPCTWPPAFFEPTSPARPPFGGGGCLN